MITSRLAQLSIRALGQVSAGRSNCSYSRLVNKSSSSISQCSWSATAPQLMSRTPQTQRVSSLHSAAWTNHQSLSLQKTPFSGGLQQTVAVQRPILQACLAALTHQPVRTRIRFRRKDGRPQTVKAVVKRFFRLGNGMWIRTRAGRHKRRWKKSNRKVAELQQHVFCTQRQCWMLDKMVNKYYKTRKFYVNDPYTAYHSKKNLPDYKYDKPPFLP